ncbi:MAG: glycosyltransferase family 4 protein [Caldilineaceae bacterium]
MTAVKVAHVTTIDLSLKVLLLNQLASIRDAGYEVTAISTPGPSVQAIEAAGVRHIPVQMARAIDPRADLRALWELYHVLRREQFDIVHTHNPKPGLLGQLAARMARVPVVVNTLHGFYFHDNMSASSRRFYIELEKVAARCSDIILSQNQEDIQTAIREGICTPAKIKHLGNGIDLSQFHPALIRREEQAALRAELGLAPDTPIVGFVGRLAAKRKGFLDFLKAGRAVVQQLPQTKLLIVGEADVGKDDAVTPHVATELGIAENCIFLGWRPNSQLPLLLSLMDLLVLPSIFEGIPRTVMEAAAMQIPCVATDVKGNREVVVEGKTGFLVPYGDVEQLTARILLLLRDPALAGDCGRHARALALERFDEESVFQIIKDEYATLLHQTLHHSRRRKLVGQ